MARKGAIDGLATSGNTATIGFEDKLGLAADTATRGSAYRNCAATWRDLREAQDYRSNSTTAPL